MLFGQIFNKRCSICGRILNKRPKSPEDVCCRICGSTWRAQAICRAILSGLGYPEDANIRFIDSDMSRVGLGISDDWRLARALSPLFAYTNSFLHKFPMIDICSPPQEAMEKFEFISCSDVLEHTPPPRKSALEGLFQMLKPGGFVVVSVPLRKGFQFAEFYPELTTLNIEKDSVSWVDGDGRDHVDQRPEFLGGEGLTLAFRQWTELKLIEELRGVGFSEVISRPMPLYLDSERTICVIIARKRQNQSQ